MEECFHAAASFSPSISRVINDFALAISALATVAIAVLTFVLTVENRKLRRAGQEPQVVAYLIPHPDGNGGVNIVFANIGTGVAKDVRFSFKCDQEDFKRHRVMITNEEGRATISVIPPGEKITALFGVGFELFGKVGEEQIAPLKPFQVEIAYRGVDGEVRSFVSEIDVAQFLGLAGVTNRPALREIERILKNMEKSFDILSKASLKFVDFVETTEMQDVNRQSRKVGDHRDE